MPGDPPHPSTPELTDRLPLPAAASHTDGRQWLLLLEHVLGLEVDEPAVLLERLMLFCILDLNRPPAASLLLARDDDPFLSPALPLGQPLAFLRLSHPRPQREEVCSRLAHYKRTGLLRGMGGAL
jgi:hypothetical protein